MYDLKILFFRASALKSFRKAYSVLAPGRSRGFLRRIFAGMVWSMSWSRESAPTVLSMWLIWRASGPMCRDSNFSLYCGSVCIEDVKRSEEHTSELQSRENLVCRLLLEK